MFKNNIQSVLGENGIQLSKEQKNHLLSPKYGKEALNGYELSSASEISIQSCFELLWRVKETKERILKEILLTG